jgi:hypothetical protein
MTCTSPEHSGHGGRAACADTRCSAFHVFCAGCGARAHYQVATSATSATGTDYPPVLAAEVARNTVPAPMMSTG